jgi:hypothetical protein
MPKMPSKPYDATLLEEGTLDTPGHLSSGERPSRSPRPLIPNEDHYDET